MRSREFWISNGVIFTQDESRKVLRGHIHIKDGMIHEIRSRMPSKTAKGIQILDAQGLTIFPGFVQAHVHLCQTLFRNQADDLELLDWLSKRIWIMESAHTKQTLYTSALLGIYELLSTGTTCVLDMGTVRHTEAIFEAVKKTGIRANVGKCLMDHPQNTPPYLRENTDRALNEATALYRKWHGQENDRIRASYAPRFVISCSETLLKEVAKLSREQRALIHTHASENQKEVELIRKREGAENVEYLHKMGLTSSDLVLAHCIWLNPREIDLLRTTGTHVVHCPSSNLKLASGIAKVPELRQKGINVALGADGAPCNNNLNMLTEMRLAALIHKPAYGPKSMNAQEVIDMATRDGARALNWFEQIGSIEVGKKADLIAFDLNQPENLASSFGNSARKEPDREAIASALVYSTQSQHLKWTMVDGRLLFSQGKVRNIPLQPLLKSVHSAQRLIARSPAVRAAVQAAEKSAK